MDRVASRPLFLILNSATSISALLIAVNDLDAAAAEYGKIARAFDREILMPEFGATAKEMVLGKRQYLPAEGHRIRYRWSASNENAFRSS